MEMAKDEGQSKKLQDIEERQNKYLARRVAEHDRPLEQVANLVKLSRAHRLADAYCHSVFEELKDILAQPRNHWLE